jgi:hypothetical protein
MPAAQRRAWTLSLMLLALLGLGAGAMALRPAGQPAARAAVLAAPAAAPPTQITLGTWSPMGALAGQAAETTSAPTAVSWGAGRLDLFVRGRSGELYQNYREQGRWSGWRVPDAFRGVELRSAPSCAAWGEGRLSCVALIAGDLAIWHFFFDGLGWARESLGGEASSAPVIVSPRTNQLAVFVAGGGGRLFGKGWVPGRWSDWRDLGGELRSAPACAVWRGDQLIHCFVTNTQGTLSRQEVIIREEVLSGRGYVPVAMNEASGNLLTLGSAPAAVALGPGRLGLFVLNRGQNLFQTTWAGQDFVVWQGAGENLALTSVPSCASVAPGRADCFARGSDSPLLKAFGDILQSSAAVR